MLAVMHYKVPKPAQLIGVGKYSKATGASYTCQASVRCLRVQATHTFAMNDFSK